MKLDDKDVLAPPPFSILYFEIEPSLDSDDIILGIGPEKRRKRRFYSKEKRRAPF